MKRYGYHTMPTTLVLAFDQPLDPTTAGTSRTTSSSARMASGSGSVAQVYDPSGLTVTLHPEQRISIHYSYGMTVKGAGSKGLRNTAGRIT